MRNQKQSGNLLGYIILGVFAISLLARLAEAAVPFIALMIAAAIAAAYIRSQSRGQQGNAKHQSPDAINALPYQPAVSKGRAVAQEVANRAMHKANNSPYARGISLLDIGLLAYDGGKQPKVSRNEAIPASATHLRPYMVINFPYTKSASGQIKFELLDHDGNVRFVADQRYEVAPGQNFLTPQNWLPMGDDEPGGDWSLRISVGEQLLALHEFKITPDAGASFRNYLRADGEIDEWITKSAAKPTTETMSLDELIGDQDEIDIDMFRESQPQRQIKERR